ncbi:MAG: hypothetical protein GX547_11910 [Phycisphaerae bacterium]|nr:hypothetical protein [Phycisphaerae bacterium]
MKRRNFGDLREWGRVSEELDAIQRQGGLDEYQEELAHMLRFRDNWRLREMALTSIKRVEAVSENLAREVLKILNDDELYQEVRMLAAEVLADALARARAANRNALSGVVRDAINTMHAIIDGPQPPVLQETVRRALAALE